ncbi:MAG: hypothetical protein JSR77_04790 [Planctomycetes bacterium]|nr:hypothetical protein [Planctomycetota bacterium]
MPIADTHRHPNSALATSLLALFVGLLSVFAIGMAPPEPDIVPRRWQLAVEPGPLRVTMIESAKGGARAYYYFTYKVTNTNAGDLLFAPSFDLVDGEGQVVRAGRDVPADVTKAIWSSLGNRALQDQIGMVGMLLQGEENAKEGLVIWPANNLHPGELSVYAAGFSGETKSVKVLDPKTNKETSVMLRKTLMLRYQTPGELREMSAKPIDLSEQRWIMR